MSSELIAIQNQYLITSSKTLYFQRVLPTLTRSSPKMTLVLDLDETLIHSSFEQPESPDNIITISSNGETKKLYVKYRPGLMEFLSKVSKNFELVIYTASKKEYAEQIINKIDPKRRIFKCRLYRDHCIQIQGRLIKDLSILGRDLKKVVIIDDSISAFLCHLNNGIPIISWVDNPSDNELMKALVLLENLLLVSDVQPVLNSIFNLPKLLEEYNSSMNS